MHKNPVPNDPRSPFVTSGLRIGSPAVTSRGFKEAECIDLTNWICDILAALEDGTSEAVEATVQAKVVALCTTCLFINRPVYK